MEKNRWARKEEFGMVRHCVERGGGYDVANGNPLIQRHQIRGNETVLMGGKPNQPIYITTDMPDFRLSDVLQARATDEIAVTPLTRHQHVAYRREQTFWVTLGVHVDHEGGILYDNGYYRTVVWYEWHEPGYTGE